MSYVDGYVLPVPKNKLAAYTKMAKQAGRIWKEHGALDYKECVAQDLRAKGMTPYSKIMKSKKGETVVFAYILFKSRAHRDQVNKKVMKDPRIQNLCDPKNPPFDFKRMCYGGFKTIVDPK